MLLEGLWRAPEVRRQGVSAKRLFFGMLNLLTAPRGQIGHYGDPAIR
jgi:hypothetical protein